MAFIALDDWCPIPVWDAVPGKIYRCIDCEKPVRLRRFRSRESHFYHIDPSPSCKLYSKSEDHLVAQLHIQRLLPPGETRLEHPFPGPLRVADLLWEPKKLAFEIQCSNLTCKEAEQRIADYALHGYEVVWILDDRLFNRRRLLGVEPLLRRYPCYYAKLRSSTGVPQFYDQFEVFFERKRIKKGWPLKANMQKPCYLTQGPLKSNSFPSQIEPRTTHSKLYFYGDLIHQAVRADRNPSAVRAMINLKALERLILSEAKKKRNPLIRWGINILGTVGCIIQDTIEWLWRKIQ